jgi:hypothetical protein
MDEEDLFNDVTNEVTGTGYTAGGAALGSKTLANTNNVVKFDAAALTAVQEIARIEREQSAFGNLTPQDALAVRRALVPVISLGLTATDALLAWEPGKPVPVEMLQLSTELGNLLTTAALHIKNDTAKLAIVIAIAAAQQAWQVAILTMQNGQEPEPTPALVGGATP